MTGNPWPSIAITAAVIALFGYLMVLSQNISARRAAAREQRERRDRINRRIAAEPNPAVRAAWRSVRDVNSEEEPW